MTDTPKNGMKLLSALDDTALRGKKVLVRVNFDLPVAHGEIADDFRVKAHRDTVTYLLDRGARVALLSHISDVEGYGPILTQLNRSLGREMAFVSDCVGPEVMTALAEASLVLLENVRQHKEEQKNDSDFAKRLATGFDLYVDDAFAVAHREHASVVAITQFLPSYAGLLMALETEHLSRVIAAPAAGKVVVLGGAKIATKLPVVRHFLDKAEHILIGGAVANNFLKHNGCEMGKSLIDTEDIKLLDGLDLSKIVLPVDAVVASEPARIAEARTVLVTAIGPEDMMLDIGPATIEAFVSIIKNASMVIWNGPLGLDEVPTFGHGTFAVAQAVANVKDSVIGGGDTIASVTKLHLLEKYGYASTGGGAMLEFLDGTQLPALKALGYYSK